MHVAFFHHYSLTHGGGGEWFVTELANFLSGQGHIIEIHALPFRRREAAIQLHRSVMYCEGPIHRSKAEIVYHVYAPFVSSLLLCRAPKIAGLHGAVVMDFESPPTFYMKQGPFVAGAYIARELLGSAYLRGFDAVHAVSPVRLPHRRIFVLPNWVDCTNSLRALEMKRERDDIFRVLYVGKPSYTKGFDKFAELSELVKADDIEFVAVFPPDPNYKGQGNIRWLGYVPHERLWEVYATASVLLHPTRQETFGRVILESLAAGTPVITTLIQSHRSLGLSLDFASTVSEMRSKLEEIYHRWASHYEDYLHRARAAAESVVRFDSRILLPQYEKMLQVVLDDASV